MKRLSQLFLYLTVALLLLWQLPWCYNFFSSQPSRTPFTMYSCVINDFLSIGYDEATGIVRRDQYGNNYTQEETDSLLPTFYVRQLMADERFPDSINGVPVTSRKIQQANFNFRKSASDLNKPIIALYPLLESMSDRVELEMPDDVFRITGQGIEFIMMNNNTLDQEKSARFTEALLKKGFKFPATYIAGNPSNRKEYDEGYLLLDRDGALFHLKQTKGRPYVRAIALPEGLKAKFLFVTEFTDRKTLGYLTDEDNHLYVLANKTYEIVKTGIPAYNPLTDNITIFGNMFDWTVALTTTNAVTYYALDAETYSLIKSVSFQQRNNSIPGLRFTSYQSKRVRPYFF